MSRRSRDRRRSQSLYPTLETKLFALDRKLKYSDLSTLEREKRLRAFAFDFASYELQTRKNLLDHTVSEISRHQPDRLRSVRPARTVRRPLIRTVPRDTRLPPSPTLLARTAMRQASAAWSIFTHDPVQRLYSMTPLHRATVCAKRSIRREVLFALMRTNGKGSGGVPKSKIRC